MCLKITPGEDNGSGHSYLAKTRTFLLCVDNHKFEVAGEQELMVRVPLPMAEVWAEMQTQVEELTGQAGLQILRAILENEVTRRVGPPLSIWLLALGAIAGRMRREILRLMAPLRVQIPVGHG